MRRRFNPRRKYEPKLEVVKTGLHPVRPVGKGDPSKINPSTGKWELNPHHRKAQDSQPTKPTKAPWKKPPPTSPRPPSTRPPKRRLRPSPPGASPRERLMRRRRRA